MVLYFRLDPYLMIIALIPVNIVVTIKTGSAGYARKLLLFRYA